MARKLSRDQHRAASNRETTGDLAQFLADAGLIDDDEAAMLTEEEARGVAKQLGIDPDDH